MTVLATTVAAAALFGCGGAARRAAAPPPAAEAPAERLARCAALQAKARAAAAGSGTVDVEPAAPRRGNAAPAYPRDQDAPPAGRVVLQFVVDTAGAVEPATVRVREATHPAFAAAARAAVAQWRFRPATLAPGCPVKFLVTAPFDFAGG